MGRLRTEGSRGTGSGGQVGVGGGGGLRGLGESPPFSLSPW